MNIYEYSRLSRYDGDNEMSDSIVNQFSIIDDFVAKNQAFCGAKIVKLSDNDFTGINLKRPAMQELLTAVRTRKADVIVIKDFSRLSREHLDLCTLIDKIFPFMNVRFISILDNYDSVRGGNEPLELSVAFKAILNEYHIISTSEKINRAFEQKMKNGEFTSGSLPFGYKWKEKGVPEIADSEAETVRYIFDLRLQGKTTKEIAGELNEKNFPLPTKRNAQNRIGLWRDGTVAGILKNPSYMGVKAYRRTTRDLKTKKITFAPENDWIVVPNMFPPIVDKKTFETVKKSFEKFYKKPFEIRKDTVMVRKLYCAHCGFTLTRNGKAYYCKKAENHGGERCFSGRIYQKNLFPKVLAVVKSILGEYLAEHKPRRTVSEKTKLERKLKNLDVQKRELFDGYADDLIDFETYERKRRN
jgi:DNA invertase Pin-like site-specific DNA recombinase